MTLRQVVELAEKNSSVGRIDVGLAIVYTNDAIRKVVEATGVEFEELIDDLDEATVLSKFEILRMKALLAGKEDKFIPLLEARDGIIEFEE